MKPSDRRITARLQQANYTAVEWVDANPVLLNGERGIESDTGREKIGDGITPWSGLRYMDEVWSKTIPGITDPLSILAHSDCTLEERIANLEQMLTDALSGKMYIPSLKVQHFEAWGDVNLVLTGSGAPTRSPDKAGQFYVDTLNRVLYFATGNTAVADWK